MNYKMIDFQKHGDDRGMLVALEENKEIPFQIKRVYYMFETGENVRRGYHAHKHLEQVLICVQGKCKIHLDDGYLTKEVCLDSPTYGLYIGNDVWREMYDFSTNAVLLVLASEIYDETDYIRDYQRFVELIRRQDKNEN
ncbi:MAG: FdtA/QdtA family cupin domain-containing protein [Acetatifactor sp.]|nr:FdtA/QdtA family cupin domain-containing protein [Acetatifactor sp.]